jgi:putative peptide maturation dehydrogenase
VTRARRPASVFLRVEETAIVDVGALLGGEIAVTPGGRLVALPPLNGGEHRTTKEELEVLLATPESQWIDVPPSQTETFEQLARRGLLLLDDDTEPFAGIRRREERHAAYWHPQAALFHASTKWRDVEVAIPSELEAPPAQPTVDADAPPPFAERADAAVHDLPFGPRTDGVFSTLARRRTTRAFAGDGALTEEQLSTLLYEVYGCRGTVAVDGEHVALKKSSPSGGGLHPIEVYPLLLRVEGFEPGLYHYRPRDHALETVAPATLEQAEALASEFTCGQSFLAAAGAVLVMTARFQRSFWKYRRHERAYTTLLLDAGHLSQTLYLVATELGLGAFVTAAMNGANVEERLGLDPLEEGAIAICACGVPAQEPSWLDGRFEPHDPVAERLSR